MGSLHGTRGMLVRLFGAFTKVMLEGMRLPMEAIFATSVNRVAPFEEGDRYSNAKRMGGDPLDACEG
jgi:hypothetical protein